MTPDELDAIEKEAKQTLSCKAFKDDPDTLTILALVAEVRRLKHDSELLRYVLGKWLLVAEAPDELIWDIQMLEIEAPEDTEIE